MTRITTLLLLILVATVAVGETAWAGDHHTGASLICSDCHVMHYSQSHGYNSDGTGSFTSLGTAGPYEVLLRNDVNDLCLYCHDNNSNAPDVMGVNTGENPGDVRLAGLLNRIDGTPVGQPATGHTLGTLSTAPGSNPAWKPEDENGTGDGLECINCHQQHGYAGGTNTYRNLRMDPGNHGFLGALVTYVIGTNDTTKDVFERAAEQYDESNVDWNEPDTTNSAIGNWCSGCHTDFHGSPGDPNTVGGVPNGSSFDEFIRHPVAGVDIGAIGGGHSSLSVFAGMTNKVKVMSASGMWDGSVGDVTPTCISCHKAHGNNNAFGLLFRSGTGTLTEDGDSNGTSVRDTCKQCHVQG